MSIVVTIARILLGLIFIVMGLNGFAFFMPPPPVLPHYAALFTAATAGSHFIWFTSGVQVIAGVLLLINRYVPLAIVVLAAVISNILAFHITMMPSTIVPGLIAAVLWFIVAWPLRDRFGSLFAQKV
jgi:uncharacterized membrane protein YphA (DoxX/SURF4 family)